MPRSRTLPSPKISEILHIPQSEIRKYDLQSLARQLFIAPASKTRAQLLREIENRLRSAPDLADKAYAGFQKRNVHADSGTMVVQMCADGSTRNLTGTPTPPNRSPTNRTPLPPNRSPANRTPIPSRLSNAPRASVLPTGMMGRPAPPPPPLPPKPVPPRMPGPSMSSMQRPVSRAGPGRMAPRLSLQNALQNQFRKDARVQNRMRREQTFESR